jgi:hypothetical protein
MNPTRDGVGGEKRLSQPDNSFIRMEADKNEIGEFIQQKGLDLGNLHRCCTLDQLTLLGSTCEALTAEASFK